MLDSAILVRRQEPGFARNAACYAGGLAAGLALSVLLLVWAGVPPEAIVNELVVEAFFTADGIAQTTTAAIPLILVGVATVITMRLQFWNIGIEGQLWLGAIAAAWIALGDVGPEAARLPLMLLAGFLAGGAWMALPLLLKLRWGVSEVISTLLLGSVAFLLVQHLLFGVWRDPATGFPISEAFDPAERFAPLGWGQLHAGLWVALAAGLLVWLLLDRTRLGFYAKAIGLNRTAARAAGMPVYRSIALLVLGAGGLCGLAGAVILAGTEHRLNQSVGVGYLFSGIVIAFLARSSPLAAMLIAFVVGGVFTAGGVLKVFYSVSEAVVVLIQGTVLMTVLVSHFFSAYRLTRPTWKTAP
ncbi:MAG: ABC transporter permease [Kiloniellaceae bacterium]